MSTPILFSFPPNPYEDNKLTSSARDVVITDSASAWSSEADCSEDSRDYVAAKPHHWKTDERIALCLLKRFYSNNWTDITRIMSATFSLGLKTRRAIASGERVGMTSAQFCDLVRFQSAEYEEVYQKTAFNQALTGHLALLEKRLERGAKRAQVQLQRRKEECVKSPAKIASLLPSSDASDPNKFRELVSDNERSLSECSISSPSPSGRCLDIVSTRSVAAHRETEKATSRICGTTASASHNSIDRPRPTTFLPPILFRTYSEDSSGINTTFGIRAGSFNALDAQKVFAPSTEDPRFSDHVADHLSRSLVRSPLISLTNSFVWALHKASTFPKNSHIAIVDTRAATKLTRFWHAAPLCAQARKRKPAAIRNYKASFEYFAWGAIHEDSITSTFKFADLQDFCVNTSSVSQLLQLESIQNSKNMFEARSRFRTLHIGHDVGTAIGRLIQFLRPGTFINEPFVDDLAQVVLQNWDNQKKTLGARVEIVPGSDIFEGINKGLNHDRIRNRNTPAENNNESLYLALQTPPITPPRRKASKASPPWSNLKSTTFEEKIGATLSSGKHMYLPTPDATPEKERHLSTELVARRLRLEFEAKPEGSSELHRADDDYLSSTSDGREFTLPTWPTGYREEFLRSLDVECSSPTAKDDRMIFVFNDEGEIVEHGENHIPMTEEEAEFEMKDEMEEHDVSIACNVEEMNLKLLAETVEDDDGSEDDDISEDEDASADELASTCRCHIGGHVDD